MIEIIQGDILTVQVDAIVNPAHVSLLAGSGLCGVIHKHAGPELEMSCKAFGKQDYGSVVSTPAFDLQSFDWVLP